MLCTCKNKTMRTQVCCWSGIGYTSAQCNVDNLSQTCMISTTRTAWCFIQEEFHWLSNYNNLGKMEVLSDVHYVCLHVFSEPNISSFNQPNFAQSISMYIMMVFKFVRNSFVLANGKWIYTYTYNIIHV